MRAHMRKHPTSSVHVKKVIQEEESVMSLEEALGTLFNVESQGAVALRGLRYKEGLTQAELGEMLEINQANVSKMECGTRPIGKIIAKKLASFFKTDYRIFL